FDATADAVNVEDQVIPSVVERVDRTSTEKVSATGERNDGKRAEGEVTMSVCATKPSDEQGVPAGTGVSVDGKNYITQETATFHTTYSACSGGPGVRYITNDVDIVAQEGGTKYNVNNSTFSVAGRSNVSAEGSASGGTDEIKKVLSQADVDSVTKKLESEDDESAKDE